ncbi:MAG: trigger factor [Acidimicrobiales bacterium]
METTLEPLEGNKVKLSVTVDETEFDRALDAAFRKIAREVRIPGFRPGKAPRRLIEARFGADTARQEALREALPDYYVRALKEHELDAIAPPEIDVTAGQESGPVTFDAVVELRPQVSIAGYGGLRATVPSLEVEESEVDRQIDRLREQFGELTPVERPARDGDHVSIDLHGTRDGEAVEGLSTDDYLYEVGRGWLSPDLDAQLRGSSAGDVLSFEVPESAEGSAAGTRFRVLVKEVREKVLPDVTDEWASEASELGTVEELRADLRQRLVAVKRFQSTMALREQALDALVELVEEEAPKALVNDQLERRIHELGHRLEAQGAQLEQYLEATGRTHEDLLAALREESVKAVKIDLALRALADAESMAASDEEVEAEIARMAEEAKATPARVRRQLESEDQLPAVRSGVRKTKALTWLLEHVEIVDPEGRPVDRAELLPTTASESAEEGPPVTASQSSPAGGAGPAQESAE